MADASPLWDGNSVAVADFAQRAHRLATHGEGPERAQQLRLDWDAHIHDLLTDVGPRAARFEIFRAVFLHLGYRLTTGEATSIATGFGMVAASVGSLSFVLQDQSPQPARVHVHLAVGLMLLALVFIFSPHEPSRIATRAAAVVLGSSMPHAAIDFTMLGPLDWLYIPGGVLIVIGSFGLLVWSFDCGADSLRVRSFVVLAVAALLFGVGNVGRYVTLQDRTFALMCAVSALSTVLLANQLMRSRSTV